MFRSCLAVLLEAFEALPPNRKVPRPVRIKLIIGERLEFASIANDRAGWSQIARSARIRSAQSGCVMTDADNFVCAASRMGDLQIAQRRTGDRPSLSSSQAGLPASRMFRVSLQLLRQIRRNVRDDQSIVALVSQFEDVTNSMDLRDQRAFLRGNPKPRAQSP